MAHSGITDRNARLQITPNTRRVTVPPACAIIGTVGDHNSEQVTFQCPKEIDGHDVLNCAQHFIVYKNAAGGVGKVHVHPVEEDDSMIFTWLISSGVTAAAGNVSFAVHFIDLEADGETIAYRWSTTTNNDLQVLATVVMPTNPDPDDPDPEAPPVIDETSDLPDVTAEDNGAFLRVVDGEWAVDQLQDASEVGM